MPNNCCVNSTVIASAAKQSRGHSTRPLDCFVARAPRNDGQWWSASVLREPVRHKAEFTTKLRLIVINPMSEKVLLAQLQKGSFNSRKCEVSPASAYEFAKIWRCPLAGRLPDR